MTRTRTAPVFILAAMLLLSGCGAGLKQRTADFNSYYDQGRYDAAGEMALAERLDESDLILWDLQAASAQMAGGKYQLACDLLDQAEDLSKKNDLENGGIKAAQVAGELLANRYILDYDPTNYDKIMINTYKGVAFMFLGKPDLARVEFNRAYDRQRRNVEYYRDEIKNVREKSKKQQRQDNAEDNTPEFDVDKALTDARLKAYRNKGTSPWAPYRDYVNPFTTYVSSLFWMNYGQDSGDLEKAVTGLKRLAGIAPGPVVDRDLDLARAMANGKPAPRDQVWIIFENGQGPVLDEFRVDIPLFVIGGRTPVKIVSMALPRLEPRSAAMSCLVAENKGRVLARTSLLASMDRIVATEFDAGFGLVLTKAVASMLIKAASQYAAYRAAGDAGAIIMSITNALTTEADLRIWTALPKNFQVARVTRPEDRSLDFLAPDGSYLGSANLPANSSALVLVRVPTAGAKPSISVIPLNPGN